MKKSIKYAISLSFVIFFMTLSCSKAEIALTEGDVYTFTASSDDSTFQPSAVITLTISSVLETTTENTVGYNLTGLIADQTVDGLCRWDPTESVNGLPDTPEDDALIEATARGLREQITQGKAWVMRGSLNLDWTNDDGTISIHIKYDGNGVLNTFHLVLDGDTIDITKNEEEKKIPGYEVYILGMFGFLTVLALIKRTYLINKREA